MKMKDCLISSVIILHYPMTSELEFCFEIDVVRLDRLKFKRPHANQR